MSGLYMTYIKSAYVPEQFESPLCSAESLHFSKPGNARGMHENCAAKMDAPGASAWWEF